MGWNWSTSLDGVDSCIYTASRMLSMAAADAVSQNSSEILAGGIHGGRWLHRPSSWLHRPASRGGGSATENPRRPRPGHSSAMVYAAPRSIGLCINVSFRPPGTRSSQYNESHCPAGALVGRADAVAPRIFSGARAVEPLDSPWENIDRRDISFFHF
jgi:hypothetical protein